MSPASKEILKKNRNYAFAARQAAEIRVTSLHPVEFSEVAEICLPG